MAEMMKKTSPNIFVPNYVVTQTEGMNIWLKQQLAKELGIVANCFFIKPNDIIIKVYALLGGTFERTVSKENLVWILYKQLNEKSFLEKFPEQANYLFYDNEAQDLKQLGLAEKLADLFDQYQIFRPEMIQEWNNLANEDAAENWQAYLWAKAKQSLTTKIPDKTIISDYILEKLKVDEECKKLKQVLPEMYLFGLSIITRYHMTLFTEISKQIDVYFYLQNPAPDIYWIDDRSEKDVVTWRQKGVRHTDSQIIGNDLLNNWGKVLRNTFSLLFKNEELINEYEIIEIEETKPTTLLSKIQNDVANNKFADRNKIEEIDLKDGSLTIHSCYTIAREVDVLYQYLVHNIENAEQKISSRDIIVLVSDINLYAPYIKAIFENEPYKFRYKISDASVTNGNNLISALVAILSLKEEELTSESLVKLLDFKSIRDRFSITDKQKIRTVIEATNIRFGIAGKRIDETDLISWNYGLKRIMYGVCMADSEEYLGDNPSFFPVDIVEGAAALEVISFCHFVEIIIATIEAQKQKRNIEDWVKHVQNLVENLLFNNEDNNSDEVESYHILINHLEKYTPIFEEVKDSFSYELFSKDLIESISQDTSGKLFASEGISFCSFIPMRSIPFKIVAILGMNDASFPRKEKLNNFNLMALKPQLGDRNIKDNDKHLFLETLLSAKEKLYLSYLGVSAIDNAKKAPSILVDELLQYIQNGMESEINVADKIIIQQPLHHFSERYNQEDKNLYRYTGKHLSDINEYKNTTKQKKELKITSINFKDLVGFYQYPIKKYYQKKLNIYYNNDDDILQEVEAFEIDNRGRWLLKNKLLQQNENVATFRNEQVKKGNLPLGNIADLSIEKIDSEVSVVKSRVKVYANGERVNQIPFEIELNKLALTGTIENVYGNKIINCCFSKNYYKNAITAYLSALAGRALGKINQLIFIYSVDNKSSKNDSDEETIPYQEFIWMFDTMNENEATEKLKNIVAFYETGINELIPLSDIFWGDLSKSKGWDEDGLLKIIAAKIKNAKEESLDPYLQNAIEKGAFEKEDFSKHFEQYYDLIIAPINEQIKIQK